MNLSRAVREIRGFNRFYTNMIGVVDGHILESPYSLTEVRIMFEIHHGLNTTVRDIKKFLRVDEGYLSRTIDKLVRQGIIRKRRSPKDARSFLLTLTPKGERTFLHLDAASDKSIVSMIRDLSSNEIEELVRVVLTIQNLLTRSMHGHRPQT